MPAMKRKVVPLMIIFITLCVRSTLAAELSTNLHVSDSGRQEIPNSIVRYVSVLGAGTAAEPFVLWYEDQSVGEGTVKCAKSLSDETAFQQGEAIQIANRLNEGQNILRPMVFQLAQDRYGMYFIDAANGNRLSYTESVDQGDGLFGLSWSEPVFVQGIEGTKGAIDALVVDNSIWLYWVDAQNTVWRSVSTAGSSTDFTGSGSMVINEQKFRPTGKVIPFTDGFYLFFTVDAQGDIPAYAGLAHSADGLNGWRVVRDAGNPLLTDQSAEREALHEFAVGNGSHAFKMFYTARFAADSVTGVESSVGFAKGQPTTVQVRKDANGYAQVATFQEAIAVSSDSAKSKIMVFPGTYQESGVLISKPLTIYAHNTDEPLPVLDFSGGTAGLVIATNDITVESLQITGAGGQAILGDGNFTGGLTLRDITVRAAETALCLQGTAAVPLENITIKNLKAEELTGSAVWLEYTGGNVVIEDCSFMGYSGKALTAVEAQAEIDASPNWWGTLCPALVVDGNVNFTPWYADALFSGLMSAAPNCQETETGQNIIETFTEQDVTLHFEEVTTAGTTSVSYTEPLLLPPAGYRFVNGYYEITTTAETVGDVAVTLPYTGEKVLGNEERLELFHYTDGSWQKITVSRDPAADQITGLTQSFSPFAVCEQESAQQPAYSSFGMNTNLLWLLVMASWCGALVVGNKK
ncbi:MAG: hypothetical protein SCK29_09105 [Bacillota bacterium]|nr:hypothetical protein [Bacillota bacterium]MDW7684257.1 hypothetical protein [Bacillota bacterium]